MSEKASITRKILNFKKKKRVINSCQYCRLKKLKCDKKKPFCSTCNKLKMGKCVYINAMTEDDISSLDSRVKAIQEQIILLEDQKRKLQENIPNITDLSKYLSLFSLFKNDLFLKCLIECSKGGGKKVPGKISEEFEREKNQKLRNDSIKLILIQNNDQSEGLFKLIKPILLMESTSYLILHFFNSELYCQFSFLVKSQFLTRYNEFLLNLPERIDDDPSIYLFLGQILLILRISGLSFYNCGYDFNKSDVNNELINQIINIDSSNLIQLANLCLDTIKKPIHSKTLDYIQLSILLEIANLYDFESISYIDDLITLDVNRLIRTASMMNFNVEPKADFNENEDSIRRCWYALVDLDYLKFLYDGTILSINEDNYTTVLPNGTIHDGEFNYSITSYFKERSKSYPFIKKMSKFASNLHNPPKLNVIENLLESIIKYNSVDNLDYILNLDSDSIEQRVLKLTKFINLLDLTNLSFMISTHLFLRGHHKSNGSQDNIEDEDGTDNVNSITVLKYVLRSCNTILKLTYFLDSNQHHFYNLQRHFGYNYNLITKILNCQHKVFQFQLSLLIKSHYFSLKYDKKKTSNEFDIIDETLGETEKSDSPFEEIKRIVTTNIKILLANFRKISSTHVYGKRLHMMHSFMILKNFDKDMKNLNSIPLLTKLDDSLKENSNLNDHDKEVYKLISEMLIELSGDEEILTTNSFEKEDIQINMNINYLNGGNETGLDSSTIDKLESFLDQSFLN